MSRDVTPLVAGQALSAVKQSRAFTFLPPAFSVSVRYAKQTTLAIHSDLGFEPDREDWPDIECQDNESSEVNTVGRARGRSWCLRKNFVTMATD
ncbi:hypothetical protein PR048_028799 [Dryococelus australis]|uniref:Uncharacterized protein n=1 Tax=Dryococelus australis TaxID=614101 RepID=A0ABQ9GFC8_9NEOP|nr:hypothetical protein PR048_028799 [Dryococelus australis]